MTRDRSSMRYWSGFATGVAVLALAGFVYLALRVMPVQLAIYRDFKAVDLPMPTTLALSLAWRLGVPVVALALLLALNVASLESETRRSSALAITAVLLLAVFVFTWWALYLPFTQLAGNISAG